MHEDSQFTFRTCQFDAHMLARRQIEGNQWLQLSMNGDESFISSWSLIGCFALMEADEGACKITVVEIPS